MHTAKQQSQTFRNDCLYIRSAFDRQSQISDRSAPDKKTHQQCTEQGEDPGLHADVRPEQPVEEFGHVAARRLHVRRAQICTTTNRRCHRLMRARASVTSNDAARQDDCKLHDRAALREAALVDACWETRAGG